MRNIVYILLLSFMVSCASSQKITTIQYTRKYTGESNSKNIACYMAVPKEFKLVTLVGGHNELEKQYVYSDSSKVYISDFESSLLNYNNIRSLGDSIANKCSEGTELKIKVAKQLGKEYKSKTVILQGKTANGLYWKDMRIGYLSIGYVNVPENKKNEFDKALASFNTK